MAVVKYFRDLAGHKRVEEGARADGAGLGRAEKREHSPSREHRENVSYRLGKWEYDHGLGLEFRLPVSLPHTFYMRNGFVSEIRGPQKTYRVYSS